MAKVYVVYVETSLTDDAGYREKYKIFQDVYLNELDAAKACINHQDWRCHYLCKDTDTGEICEIV